jgi:type IV pilus assembly protein PilO
MDMNLDSLKRLPLKMKALIVVVICLLLGYFYYMFLGGDIFNKQRKLDGELTAMQQQIADKEAVVAQLAQFIKDVDSLKESFKLALLKLPNEREIAALLASVVLAGEDAHINFLLFEPKPPEPPKPPEGKPGAAPAESNAAAKSPDGKKNPKENAVPEKFYDEIPVRVQIEGSFHNTLSFFAKVAKLPRIINVEDIAMSDSRDVKGKGRIVKTSCTVKTYMFVDKKS